jgi:aspartyl-tRNA synthetase
MFKDLKKINYTPYLLVAGGFVTILLFMNSLRVVSDLSSTDKTSETLIEMPNIPSVSDTQPSVTTTEETIELDQNTKALNARSEILAKADGVYSQILETTKSIDEQRALSWLLFAKKEAHKTQQTSREFLTSKFLGQIEQLRSLTNNQWLTTTSDKAKDFYWIAGEARAILMGLTKRFSLESFLILLIKVILL